MPSGAWSRHSFTRSTFPHGIFASIICYVIPFVISAWKFQSLEDATLRFAVSISPLARFRRVLAERNIAGIRSC